MEVVVFLSTSFFNETYSKHFLEIIKWLTDVHIRHEILFTSIISYIFIIYKGFYFI